MQHLAGDFVKPFVPAEASPGSSPNPSSELPLPARAGKVAVMGVGEAPLGEGVVLKAMECS